MLSDHIKRLLESYQNLMISLLIIYHYRMRAAHTPVYYWRGGGDFEVFALQGQRIVPIGEIDFPTQNFTPTQIYEAHISIFIATCL